MSKFNKRNELSEPSNIFCIFFKIEFVELSFPRELDFVVEQDIDDIKMHLTVHVTLVEVRE